MALDITLVMGKVQSFIDVLERMSPKEKEGKPAVSYGKNFNDVLSMARELQPNLDPRLWPQPLNVGQYGRPVLHVGCSFAEVETFARQIRSNIAPLYPKDDPTSGASTGWGAPGYMVRRG